jgi:hypothetical protein
MASINNGKSERLKKYETENASNPPYMVHTCDVLIK